MPLPSHHLLLTFLVLAYPDVLEKKRPLNRCLCNSVVFHSRKRMVNWWFIYALRVRTYNKSSAVAEMGDRGHNRHGPKRGGGALCPFRGALGTHLIQCGLRRCLLPHQVASSSIQPFGYNSVGCHSPHRNISTNYYLVVEMHTLTVRSDDARYLLN